MFSRLDSIPLCDRRTNRQTDGRTDGRTDILPKHRPRYVYASRDKKHAHVFALQATSLKTVSEPTCVSRQCSAFFASSRWWSTTRGHGSWIVFIGWNQTTMNFCVLRHHQTRRWTPSHQEANVWHRAFKVAHLAVTPSTTGTTHNSVSSSTTVRVLMPYNRTVSTSRWRLSSFAVLKQNSETIGFAEAIFLGLH